MSSKINIKIIIKDHLDTLIHYKNKKKSKIDIMTFFVIPLLISYLLAYFCDFLNSDFLSLLMTFISIIISLLISVLVLVYDQSTKIEPSNEISILKKQVLDELFSNISYTILVGILTITLSLSLTFLVQEKHLTFNFIYSSINIPFLLIKYIFNPLILFGSFQIILTLFMILKRLHIIFFANQE